MTFLKKMLDDTKTMADAKAHARPNTFEADVSNEQTSMTPMVNGSRDMYVFGEYRTLKTKAYAMTVNKGERA